MLQDKLNHELQELVMLHIEHDMHEIELVNQMQQVLEELVNHDMLVIELQGFNENATNATNNVLQELVNQHAEMHNVANIVANVKHI